MKLLVFVLALSCTIVYASANLSSKTVPLPSTTGPVLPHNERIPRQVNLKLEEPKKNSISFHGTQPLSGSNRQPTWDLNANRNIYDNGRTTADVFGGLGKTPGQRVQPHIGIQAERNFGNNGFIRGHTQFQPGPRGHGLSPSVGISGGFRFRREAEPQERNSISFQGTQPLSGPIRQPTWDLNANRNIFDNGRTTADVFGGLNKTPGQRVTPHLGVSANHNIFDNGRTSANVYGGVSKTPGQRAQPNFGIQAERNFGNGFIRGQTDFNPRPSGRGFSPSVGITGGFRFRREAEPQERNSISFHGTQPLSGPNRQPTWDLNANRNIFDNGRTTADVFGGLNKTPGQRVQPHFGIQAERNFDNNGFIRGHTQFQPGPRGHGLSPTIGVSGGFRFRREAEDADEVESTEEY